MSLKVIELQIAIPKTFEAGKMAEQKQQQSQLSQEAANMRTEEQAVKNRETVLESEKTAELDKDEKNDSSEQKTAKEKTSQEDDEGKKAKHPYKGSFVDFIG